MTVDHCLNLLCTNRPSNVITTGLQAQCSPGFGDEQENVERRESPLVVKVSPKFRKPVCFVEGDEIILKVRYFSSSPTRIKWRKAGTVHMNETCEFSLGPQYAKAKISCCKSQDSGKYFAIFECSFGQVEIGTFRVQVI